MSHFKAIGGVKHSHHRHHPVSKQTPTPAHVSTKKKSATSKSSSSDPLYKEQKGGSLGGVGRGSLAGGAAGNSGCQPLIFSGHDGNVALSLRRVGDACNGLSQRLLAHVSMTVCDHNQPVNILVLMNALHALNTLQPFNTCSTPFFAFHSC